jgi:hypothetical protein
MPEDEQGTEKKAGVSGQVKAWLWKTGLPTGLIAIGAWISMQIPASIPVEIETIVSRVSLTAAAETGTSNQILSTTNVCAIDLRGFRKVEIPEAAVQIAGKAWRKGSLMLQAAGASKRFTPKITIRTLAKCGPGLRLDGLNAGSGSVVVASPGKSFLTVDLSAEQRGSVTLPEEFELDAENCGDPAAPFPAPQPLVRMRVSLAPHASQFLRFESAEEGMSAQMELAPGGAKKSIIPEKGGFRVQAVDFRDQGVNGAVETTLAGAGKISFPGTGLPLTAKDFLTAEPQTTFYVSELGTGEKDSTLYVRMSGAAEVLQSGERDKMIDRRPTWFDKLAGDPRGEKFVKAVKSVRDLLK